MAHVDIAVLEVVKNNALTELVNIFIYISLAFSLLNK